MIVIYKTVEAFNLIYFRFLRFQIDMLMHLIWDMDLAAVNKMVPMTTTVYNLKKQLRFTAPNSLQNSWQRSRALTGERYTVPKS